MFFDRPALSDIIMQREMKKIRVSLFALGALHTAFCAQNALAVDFPLSKYGQIQNVQSYSSNPFYNSNSPYNQRFPKPIYAQGTELNAGECRTVADDLVAQQCAQRNNCMGLSYSDVRPAIIIQMSSMSGHNYVTACSGYIQSAFEDYMKNNSTAGTGFPTDFPVADVPTEKPSSELVLNNPYALKDPDWQTNRNARQKEMRDLQRENGSDDVALEATKFPTTYADLSFTQRMENDKAGYEPWKDSSAYKPIKIESDENRYKREADIAEQQAALEKSKKELLKAQDHCAYCLQYKDECYNDYATKLENNNAVLRKQACIGKQFGVEKPFPAWSLVESEKCGWELKTPEKSGVSLPVSDAECNVPDPNVGACPKDSNGEAGASGETKPCKMGDGVTDGNRLCTNGVWSICENAEVNASSVNTSSVNSANNDKLDKLIKAIQNSRKK